jgi:GNAT superfamily N-acetyltransferase
MIRIELVEAARTRELRRAVLRPAWPIGSVMPGDEEPGVLHLAALEDGEPVSACVLFPRPYPLSPDTPNAWQLRGMASAERVRGTGIGGRLVQTAAQHVRERGGRLLWCHARVSAQRFYERCGFVVDSDEFVPAETGVPHRTMYWELDAAATSSSSAGRTEGPTGG